MVKDGQFPKPTKISENISAWNVKTLRKKIEELESKGT
jgi:predicted DNA-binding transcriptional regulator AlpA